MVENNKTPQKPATQTQPSASPPAPAMPDYFWQPFAGLREMDRLFDNLLRGFGSGAPRRGEMMPPWRSGQPFSVSAPAVDVTEDDKEYRITAELPGLGREDLELGLSGNMLTIKGEKKDKREEKAVNYYLSERRFGTFRRTFELPQNVKRDGIDASFDKGVLTVILPKMPDATQQTQKIEVKPG